MKIERLSADNVFSVARWEFLRTIKSPTFLILTVVVPLVMLLSGGLSVITSRVASSEVVEVAIVDEVGDFYPLLEGDLADPDPGPGLRMVQFLDVETAEAAIRAGALHGVAVFDPQTLEEGVLRIYTAYRQEGRIGAASNVLRRAVTRYRLLDLGLTAEQIGASLHPIRVETRALDGEQGSGWIAAMLIPTIIAMVLIFSAVFSGQIMMYGVIKEKRNRIVEILLSSVSSMELLVGKLIGFGALGLLQISLWVGVGLMTASHFFDLTGLMPSTGIGLTYLAYFVLGYLLLASMFAAMGATMKDAEGGGQVQGLVVLIPMIPVFLAGPLAASPNALWARILSHIPPFIPSATLLRMAGTDLPAWEIASTLTLLGLSVAVFVYLSARIFEGGILRFERATTLREAVRMMSGDGGK